MPRKRIEGSDFGARLVELRRTRGLTQVELAVAAGMTQRAISYYENEAAYPPAPAVIELARALGVTTDGLLGLKPPKADPLERDPNARRLWRKFRKVADLPEKDQRAVIRLINSLARANTRRSA